MSPVNRRNPKGGSASADIKGESNEWPRADVIPVGDCADGYQKAPELVWQAPDSIGAGDPAVGFRGQDRLGNQPDSRLFRSYGEIPSA